MDSILTGLAVIFYALAVLILGSIYAGPDLLPPKERKRRVWLLVVLLTAIALWRAV